MKTAASIVAIVVAAALGGCAHHQAQSAQAPAQAQAQGGAASCALAQIPGVHASVADVHNGVAITFTGPQNQLDQLRNEIHAMADANDKQGNAFSVCPCALGTYAQGAAEAMPGTQQAAGTSMPRANSSVDEISTGAVLKLEAKDKSQVQALRSGVRDNVRALRQNCLSQQGQGQGQYGQPYQGQQPYGQ